MVPRRGPRPVPSARHFRAKAESISQAHASGVRGLLEEYRVKIFFKKGKCFPSGASRDSRVLQRGAACRKRGPKSVAAWRGDLIHRTAATLLLGSGADIKTVQAVLGHARASHTLDIYADSIPGNVESAMDRLDAVVLGA